MDPIGDMLGPVRSDVERNDSFDFPLGIAPVEGGRRREARLGAYPALN
ncbi:MAG: hypothetical protein LC126_23370 [Bryobacterales bacterium]|nr:hypothetical protein [Bryobacterales bacterium]